MLARPQQAAAAPKVVVQPKPTPPLTPSKPLLPTPVPTKSAATTSVLVRPPTPKPVVKDKITPILDTVASTTLMEVPSIVADVTILPAPVTTPYMSEPIELNVQAVAEAPAQAPTRSRFSSFMSEVGRQISSFFSPIF
jgi:hypothetical protein